jgi:O-Antigen ligase
VYGREPSKPLLQPHELVPGLVAALAVAALAFDSGGYEPTSWGWSAILLLLVSAASLLLGARRLAPLELALPVSLAAFAAWVWLSLAWTSDVAQTVREGERALVYVAAATALLLVGRRSRVFGLVASLAAAITAVCTFALAARLFDPGGGAYQVGLSDPQAGFRLARPLGYANALAIFAVIGILLTLGLALRARPRAARALASSALVVLAPTLYFTYGRGAWIGLAAGLVALFAVERERLELLGRAIVLAVAPTVAVFLASRTAALTADPRSVAAATHDGRRLAIAIAVLAVAAAFLPAAVERAGARLHVGTVARRRLLLVTALLAVALAAAAIVRVGGPQDAARRAYHAFNAPAPLVGPDASERLFSLSGSNRSEYWRVAWREWKDHAALGGGAGSYQRFWLRHRTDDLPVRDAHSLYLETFAELGPIGLALLLCALAAPLVAVGAARRNPLAAGALGGYVAYLVHAGIDWDWEMPAVTLAALACGITLLLAARGADGQPLRRAPRIAAAAAAAPLACVALLGLVGNRAELASADALDAAQLSSAADEARLARRWEPWSGTPWRLLGESQLQSGEVSRARHSFVRGLEHDRGDWELWLDLALVSRGDERRAALARVAELNPLSSELRQLTGAS